jgi:hypothetical protein
MQLVTLSQVQNVQTTFQIQWQHKTKTTYPAVESRQYVTSLILVDSCHVSKNVLHNQNYSLLCSHNFTDSKPEWLSFWRIISKHVACWQVTGKRCVSARPAFPHVDTFMSLTIICHCNTSFCNVITGGIMASVLPDPLEYLGRLKNLLDKIQIWLRNMEYLFHLAIYWFSNHHSPISNNILSVEVERSVLFKDAVNCRGYTLSTANEGNMINELCWKNRNTLRTTCPSAIAYKFIMVCYRSSLVSNGWWKLFHQSTIENEHHHSPS